MATTDVTRGSLFHGIIALAWPSVIQAVLSNFYAFNDFVFVGHIADKTESAAATAALGATVGLQVILFAFHNCVPSGANTYTSQAKGAQDLQQTASIFRSAFFSCITLSTFVAVIGYTQIHHIAKLCNSEPLVEESIISFYKIVFLGAPAFGLLLLIDGFFKSNGDTRTPLMLVRRHLSRLPLTHH